MDAFHVQNADMLHLFVTNTTERVAPSLAQGRPDAVLVQPCMQCDNMATLLSV